MRPPAAVVLLLLAHAERLEQPAPGGRHPGGDEGHRVGSHGEAADGRGVVGDERQHGVGHQQHGLGATHRLLGVDEPAAAPAGLQDEVAPAHRVRRAGARAAPRGPSSGRSGAHRRSPPGPCPAVDPAHQRRLGAGGRQGRAHRVERHRVDRQHHAEAQVEDPGHLLGRRPGPAGRSRRRSGAPPTSPVEHGVEVGGQDPEQVAGDAAAGDVGRRRAPPPGAGVDGGQHGRGVDDRGPEQLVGQRVRRPRPRPAPSRSSPARSEQHVAGQGVAVGAQTRRGQADQHVALGHPLGTERARPRSTTPTAKPAMSRSSAAMAPGCSAVSPPSRAQPAWRQPSATPATSCSSWSGSRRPTAT